MASPVAGSLGVLVAFSAGLFVLLSPRVLPLPLISLVRDSDMKRSLFVTMGWGIDGDQARDQHGHVEKSADRFRHGEHFGSTRRWNEVAIADRTECNKAKVDRVEPVQGHRCWIRRKGEGARIQPGHHDV